jgi:large subunit ribosomal protein L25
MAALRALKTFRVRELAVLPSQAASTVKQLPNPFLPHKNPVTGRWAPAKYSLRRQAELIKSAKVADLVHLLPIGPKYSLEERLAARIALGVDRAEGEWWQQKVEWQGELQDEKEPPKNKVVAKKRGPILNLKQMDGLGAIKLYAARKRMFKGHKWERVKAARDRKTRMLMRSMGERIERYRKVSSGVWAFAFGLTFDSGTRVAVLILSNHQGRPPNFPNYHFRLPLDIICFSHWRMSGKNI